MLDTSYGAIKADNTKGFLIGDVSNGTTQYAVKGIFASPQGTKDVIKQFQQLKDQGFSPAAFANLIKYFTYDELHRGYEPQIQKMSQRSINGVINYAQKHLTNIV